MGHTRQVGTVQFGTTTIRYAISRSSRRKTIALTVHPDGTLSVVAPVEAAGETIAEAVFAKAGWILRQQEYFCRHHDSYAKKFVSGESFFYLGRQYKLKVKQVGRLGQPAQVRMLRGQLFTTIPHSTDPSFRADMVRRELTQWYREKAIAHIPRTAALFSSRLGLTYSTVQIREMKQRWGSARANGRVSFNWRIIMAPKRLVEYVVAHELCHLKHHNHSRDFWQLLERAMPDYDRRREELAKVGQKFDLTRIDAGETLNNDVLLVKN